MIIQHSQYEITLKQIRFVNEPVAKGSRIVVVDVMENVLQCTWSVLTYSMMSELRGKGDSQYTVRYWEYVWILRRVALHGKMWARWSRGSTLHQQGCILTGSHGHFLVVPAFFEEFAHYFLGSLRLIFVMF